MLQGLITWEVNVDSTIMRAHQHAAGARERGDLRAEPPGAVATRLDKPAVRYQATIHIAAINEWP
jgi:hypothetical protein